MNVELFYHLNTFINVLITLAVLFLVVYKKPPAKKTIVFIALIFLVQITSLFVSIPLTLILTLSLLALLFVVLTKPAYPKVIDLGHIITQAKEQERSRIYANLHDDVGAKLLELIYNSESDKTKSLAKEVLSDIRQAVASTLNIQCNTKQLAEEISQEIRTRLHALDIKFNDHFDATDLHKLAANIPSILSRIMREATSNIIKHAHATKVNLFIASTDNCLSLILEDNGVGFNANKKHGKGLKTIQKRAQSINAEVNWKKRDTNGTKFTLIYYYGNE